MKPFDAVIFDLDGTLWDTCASCALSWNNLLDDLGINFRKIQAGDIRSVAGRPHSECIDIVFASIPGSERKLICEKSMLEDNKVIARMGGMLYPGVIDGLHTLNQHYPLAIVSNCQTGYIETFLDFLGEQNIFMDYECWGNTGKSKGENLASLIRRNDFRSPVYVGDTAGDRDAALVCSIEFIQAGYGFGSPLDGCVQANSFADVVRQIR